jgi:hypothetical protein
MAPGGPVISSFAPLHPERPVKRSDRSTGPPEATMLSDHSPASHDQATWRRTGVVLSGELPSNQPGVPAAHVAPAPQPAHRRPSGQLSLGVAPLHPVDVAADVALLVAVDVPLTLRLSSAWPCASYPLCTRSANGYPPVVFRSDWRCVCGDLLLMHRMIVACVCAWLAVAWRKPSCSHSGAVAHGLRLNPGISCGRSSIHLRMHGGRLPLMKRYVAGTSATELAVHHRMAVALPAAMTTAEQAVIL